jgi:adenylate kinase
VIDVPQDVSLRRILGHMACTKCGRNYSIESPPEVDRVCDVCKGEVVRRTDDLDEKTVLSRLDTYHRQTEPLKAYYDERGLLREVDGEGTPEEVFARIVSVL